MDARKEQILNVAQKIFARFGIKKTTMEEIAQLARMGKSTLYYYFKSKEDIFAEVIRKESNIVRKKLEEAVNKAKTPQEKIAAYVLTRMKYFKELSNYYTSLTDGYLEHYSFVEKEREEFTRFEMVSLKKILEEGVSLGVFQIENVGVTARMITLAMKGMEYPLIVDNSVEDMEHEIQLMLNIFFKGIEKR